MRTPRSRRLPDGRTLTWTDVRRRQSCATVVDFAADGAVGGVPSTDDELRRQLLRQKDSSTTGAVPGRATA